VKPLIFTSLTSAYIGLTLLISKYLQQKLIGGPFLGSYIENASLSTLTIYSAVKIALAMIYLLAIHTTRFNAILIVIAALFIRGLGGPFMFTLIGASVVEKYMLKSSTT